MSLHTQLQLTQRQLAAAIRRIEKLEMHVQRLESDWMPPPDSYDCREPLPPMGEDE